MPTIDNIYDAIIANDTDTLKEYLEGLEANNTQLDKIKSLAFMSIYHNRVDCLKILISQKADITFPIGWALIYAKERGSLEIYNYIRTGETC